MPRLTDLLVAALDHVFPPAYPELGGRQFFEEQAGIWVREDFTNRGVWGYAGVRLSLADVDDPARLERFLQRVCSSLLATSIHMGLASWPLRDPIHDEWEIAKETSTSQALLDLGHSRKAWLKSIGLRERMGYVIARVALWGDEATQTSRLKELAADLHDVARRFDFEARPLSDDEVRRVDTDAFSESGPWGNRDFVLTNERPSFDYPALLKTLADSDLHAPGTYHATLDVVPERCRQRVRAHVRLRAQTGRHGPLLGELDRRGIRAHSVRPRKRQFFPLAHEVSRWPVVAPDALIALAPLAGRAGAMHPSWGGMHLKSMTGEFRGFAPFRSECGANTVVVGEDKADRHGIACELLTTHLAAGGHACVIDDSGAFVLLAARLEGKVMVLGKGQPLGLDPLRAVKDDYDLWSPNLSAWLVTLSGVARNEMFCRCSNQALHDAWVAYGPEELSLSRVHQHLIELDDPESLLMAKGLEPYIGTGAYAWIFKGEPSLAGEKSFTVIDVTAWKDDPALPHVVHAFLQLQTRRYRQADFLRVKKLVVLNESSGVSTYPVAMESWLRTLRKYGMGALVLVRPRDVVPGAAFAPLTWNFQHWIVLSLTPEAKEALCRELKLSEFHVWQLQCFAGDLFHASSFLRGTIRLLLHTQGETHAFEFRPDPMSRAAFALPDRAC
jgi:hypothetical protein